MRASLTTFPNDFLTSIAREPAAGGGRFTTQFNFTNEIRSISGNLSKKVIFFWRQRCGLQLFNLETLTHNYCQEIRLAEKKLFNSAISFLLLPPENGAESRTEAGVRQSAES